MLNNCFREYIKYDTENENYLSKTSGNKRHEETINIYTINYIISKFHIDIATLGE